MDSPSSFFDVHSHLNDPRFADDLPATLERMRAADVATIVVGTDKTMSEDAVRLAAEHSDIWATVGQHPVDKPREIFDETFYTKLAATPRVVAIGEVGLDYYWPSHDGWKGGEDVEKKRQIELFERQIIVAEKVGKPLMIHGRPSGKSMDAYEDILAILKKHPGIRGNVHFFVGTEDIARQFLDIGFTLSFTGVLTFTHDYDAVVRYIPDDRILAETDSPYVAPAPHRGKRNEPAYVKEVYAAIAKIKGKDLKEMRVIIYQNSLRLIH